MSGHGAMARVVSAWPWGILAGQEQESEEPDKQSDTRNLRIGIATYMAKTILEKFDPVSQTEYEKERLH
ncbi:hypothetical protein SDJN02_27455, partial [Cucurbita argyrosperma subsp. argyrosperma]